MGWDFFKLEDSLRKRPDRGKEQQHSSAMRLLRIYSVINAQEQFESEMNKVLIYFDKKVQKCVEYKERFDYDLEHV
jgi:hypothetical protein